MIDPLLLEEYNAGIERARTAYWHATSPIAAYERTVRHAERKRRNKERQRERDKQRGRAA